MLNKTIKEFGHEYVYYEQNGSQWCRCSDEAYRALRDSNKTDMKTFYFVNDDFDKCIKLENVNYYLSPDNSCSYSFGYFCNLSELDDLTIRNALKLVYSVEKLENMNRMNINFMYNKQADNILIINKSTKSHFFIKKGLVDKQMLVDCVKTFNDFYFTYVFQEKENK